MQQINVIIIITPSAMVHFRCNKPFITFENNWAKQYDSKFLFENFDLKYNKSNIIFSPEELLKFQPLSNRALGYNYVQGILHHSTDFNECYLSLSVMRYIKNNKTPSEAKIIKYLRIDNAFLDKLFDHFNYKKPYSTLYESSASKTTSNISQPLSYDDFIKNL